MLATKKASANKPPPAPVSNKKVEKRGFDAFDFDDKEISIDDLENDMDLMGELSSLGWKEPGQQQPQPPLKMSSSGAGGAATSSSSSASRNNYAMPNQVPEVLLDLDEEFDESKVELTEEDMNDPELLAQFAEFAESGNNDEEDQESGNAATIDQGDLIDFSQDDDGAMATTTTAASAMVSYGPPTIAITSPAPSAISAIDFEPTATAPTVGMTAAEAKQMALKLKKQGKTDEALIWLRKAKMIEMGGSVSPTALAPPPNTATSSNNSSGTTKASAVSAVGAAAATSSAPARASAARTSSTTPSAKPAAGGGAAAAAPLLATAAGNGVGAGAGVGFSLLEDALRGASDLALREAKRLKGLNDNKAALDRMREYKRYEQELTVLEARRCIPGALPAPFRWNTTRKEHKVENLDVGVDQIKLVIEAASDLDAEDLRSISAVKLTYDLSVPKDAPLVGVIPGTIANGKINFNFNSLLPLVIKRTSAKNILTMAYQRKRATFELTAKKGFIFKEKVNLGTASISLGDLLNNSECGGILSLTKENEKGKAKAVPGSLTVNLKIRFPILGPQVTYTEERSLVLEPWPEVVVTQAAAPASTAVAAAALPLPPAAPKTSAPVPIPVAAAPAVVSLDAMFSDVSQKEKQDPLGVEWLVSSDVLDEELVKAQQGVATCKDEDQLFFLNLRVQLISVKLNMLVENVQEERLSMADYLGLIKDRLLKDKRLAEYLQAAALRETDMDDKRKLADECRQVRRRAEVMATEIKGAEETTEDC